MTRAVVMQTWDGPRVLHRLRDPADLPGLSDAQVFHELERLGLLTPELRSGGTEAEPFEAQSAAAVAALRLKRRERLGDFPTLEDLSRIAIAHLPRAGGIVPTVRVMELAGIPRARGVGAAGGPAGRRARIR